MLVYSTNRLLPLSIYWVYLECTFWSTKLSFKIWRHSVLAFLNSLELCRLIASPGYTPGSSYVIRDSSVNSSTVSTHLKLRNVSLISVTHNPKTQNILLGWERILVGRVWQLVTLSLIASSFFLLWCSTPYMYESLACVKSVPFHYCILSKWGKTLGGECF